MRPATRNFYIELLAVGVFLVSLFLLLATGYFTAMSFVSRILGDGTSPEPDQLLVGALTPFASAAALIATAWGLRSLVVEEGAPDE